MKKIFKKEISIIVPAYNEQGSIKELIERLSVSLSKEKFKYEIIVIDDRSSDKTATITHALSSVYPVRHILKKGKQGKAYSLFEGFSEAKYSNLALIDADLQYPPEEIVKMTIKLREADIVCSNRRRYKDNILRRTLSRGFRFGFGKFLFGLDHDIQSGLKVFTSEVIRTIYFKPSSAWTFDLAFLHSAREAGFSITNHDITFSKRKKGESKIGVFKTVYEIGTSAVNLKLAKLHPRLVHPEKQNTMRGAGIRYKRKKYVTHTTLHHSKSSVITFTSGQKFTIALLIELAVMGLILSPIATLSFIVAFLSFIYFSDTLFNLFVVLKSLHFPQEISFTKQELSKLQDAKLPVYTILCPLYKEAHIIPQFVENISALSWPKKKLDVMLLLEEDDKDSIIAAQEMNLPSYVRIVVVPNSQPKTKPKACNYGLSFAKGEYLVIFDAEDKPEPMQLKKAYAAFQKTDRNVVCLQAKLNYYNPSQNLLTRFFTAEYSLWFDITLTGLQSINTSIPLGGTSNHFRTADLHKLQGWDPFNVTEDADLGMRLFKGGYKTAIIDSLTLEEANSKWGNWIRQRSRWIKGYMQTYLVHTRDSVSFAKKRGLHFPIFHLIIGGKIAFILINPLLWIATIAYFTLYAYVGPTIEKLYPAIVFYMAAFSLIFGNFLFMYYYMIGVMKREHYSLIKYTFLIPFYWLMISIAGFMALYQLIFKPFYWEKTVHGLHLLNKQKKIAIAVPEPVAPRPAFRLPVPDFRFPKVSITKGFLGPFVFIGSAERASLSFLAGTLIVIGIAERKVITLGVTAFKKAIVTPLKYASSILF